VISTLVIVVVLLAIIIWPYFTPPADLADPIARLAPPGGQHLLGTDDLGRDLLSRTLAGARTTMLIATLATIIPVVLGMALGVIAGYGGRVADAVITRVFDVIIAFPALLLGILFGVALGASATSVIVALSISQLAFYGRLARAGVISAKSSEYVQSVVVMGFRRYRIIVRHILPNITMPVIIVAASHIGMLAIAESSLSFLGAGIQPPSASLGNIIAEGQTFLQPDPLISLAPGVLLTIIAISFSFLSDSLRDAFDVKQAVADNNQPLVLQVVK
jgi:peptide/nickel transport system permease protein